MTLSDRIQDNYSRRAVIVSIAIAIVLLTFLSVPAFAADMAATYSITGNKNNCNANWSWYQGGTSGTLLSSGSVDGGFLCSKVTGQTVQPAAADTIRITVYSGPCSHAGGGSFTPGSHINFKVDVTCPQPDYGSASKASFSINS